jgi:HTH-type transcriptional regulator/antitoxin HigA
MAMLSYCALGRSSTQLWSSNDPADVPRLEAQARLIAAYEEKKWPRRPPSVADLIRHLMDQHGLTRADLVPLLGTPSRVSEVLRGKKGLSMALMQRLRARFRVMEVGRRARLAVLTVQDNAQDGSTCWI